MKSIIAWLDVTFYGHETVKLLRETRKKEGTHINVVNVAVLAENLSQVTQRDSFSNATHINTKVRLVSALMIASWWAVENAVVRAKLALVVSSSAVVSWRPFSHIATRRHGG